MCCAGSNPTSNWRLSGGVQRVYDKSVKSFVLRCEGGPTLRMQLPRDERRSLGLTQPCLSLQLSIPDAKAFSVEFSITDSKRTRRRLIFSTSIKEIAATTLHARLPLVELSRSGWSVLSFDLSELVSESFGASFARLDAIVIGASCRLRRVFTLREPPNHHGMIHCATETAPILPKGLELPIGTPATFQLYSIGGLKAALAAAEEGAEGARAQLHRITSQRSAVAPKSMERPTHAPRVGSAAHSVPPRPGPPRGAQLSSSHLQRKSSELEQRRRKLIQLEEVFEKRFGDIQQAAEALAPGGKLGTTHASPGPPTLSTGDRSADGSVANAGDLSTSGENAGSASARGVSAGGVSAGGASDASEAASAKAARCHLDLDGSGPDGGRGGGQGGGRGGGSAPSSDGEIMSSDSEILSSHGEIACESTPHGRRRDRPPASRCVPPPNRFAAADCDAPPPVCVAPPAYAPELPECNCSGGAYHPSSYSEPSGRGVAQGLAAMEPPVSPRPDAFASLAVSDTDHFPPRGEDAGGLGGHLQERDMNLSHPMSDLEGRRLPTPPLVPPRKSRLAAPPPRADTEQDTSRQGADGSGESEAGPRGDASAANPQEGGDDLDLMYDPVLNRYYDPRTNKYYERA